MCYPLPAQLFQLKINTNSTITGKNVKRMPLMWKLLQLSCGRNIIRRTLVHKVTADTVKPEVHEVTIPVPWGYVAGKWWGDANSKHRPILAIHGWQDNAGSFDNLMEHLVIERPVLAIDLPGHGWSSHIYPTMIYHEIDMVLLIRRIQKHYGWEKVSFLTHSMGGISSFLFSSLYPEFVDFVINLDLMKPFEQELKIQADKMGALVDRIIDLMMRTPSHTGWTANELRERWIKGTGNSLTKESAQVLMKRGIKEVCPGRFVYSRDPRVKAWSLHRFECSENVRLAKNIKCPVLLINANKSPFWKMSTDSCPEIVNTMKESCKSFEVITLNGTHHIHLNDPDCVAPVITEFLDKVKAMT